MLIMGAMMLLFRMVANFQPSRSVLVKDLNAMKQNIHGWLSDLVPWDSKEDFELFSFNQIGRKIRRGLTTKGHGVFTSIYHEPMVAYAFKKYLSKSRNALIYARTSANEYMYRIKNKGTEIFLNNKPIGFITPDGKIQTINRRKLLGTVDKTGLDLHPIHIGQKDIGGLTDPKRRRSPTDRAFAYIKTDDEDERHLLLSVALIEMIQNEMYGDN